MVHADERDRAATTGYGGVPKGQLQKRREFLPRHLAGSHGELAVPNAPQSTHMAIDGNVVGRIGEDDGKQVGEPFRRARRRAKRRSAKMPAAIETRGAFAIDLVGWFLKCPAAVDLRTRVTGMRPAA